MTQLQPMHVLQARGAQIGLSYCFLLGFFVMVAMQGLGYLKIDVVGELKDVLMLVMSFWFMRQRETTNHPIQPVAPAPTEIPK